MKDNDQKKKPINKWLALINIPFQMGIIIVAFAFLGQWLDEKYPNPKNIYTIVITLIGVFVALYNVLKQVKDINKE